MFRLTVLINRAIPLLACAFVTLPGIAKAATPYEIRLYEPGLAVSTPDLAADYNADLPQDVVEAPGFMGYVVTGADYQGDTVGDYGIVNQANTAVTLTSVTGSGNPVTSTYPSRRKTPAFRPEI